MFTESGSDGESKASGISFYGLELISIRNGNVRKRLIEDISFSTTEHIKYIYYLDFKACSYIPLPFVLENVISSKKL